MCVCAKTPWIKFRKYLHFFRKSENSDHSFNMVVYEKNFFYFFEKYFKCPEETTCCTFKYLVYPYSWY